MSGSPSSSDQFDAPGTESQPMELIQTVEAMELRLHRLEQAVASLQDHSAIVGRVTVESSAVGGTGDPVPEKPIESNQSEPAKSNRAEKNQAASESAHASKIAKVIKRSWLLWDIWTELIAIIRMFFDVRYHVGWFARLTVLIFIPVILTSHWWLPFPPLFGLREVLDKVFDLLLAFFTFKVLNREAQRYRAWKVESRTK